MKLILFILLMFMIGWNGIQQFRILELRSILWECDRGLGQCIQATGISEQELENYLDKQAQIEYQENLEPIDIYSEDELEEFYDIPTTEEAYIEPKDKKVCISWKYYAWGNDVCQEWVIIVE